MSPLSIPLQALCEMYRSDPDKLVAVDVGALFQPRPRTVPAWDPSLKRFGMLWLEPQYVQPSAALDAVEDVAEGQRPPVLCLPYLDGRCPMAESCPKLHVAPEYVQSVRQCLSSLPHNNCCLGHGDVPSLRRDFRNALSRMSILITTESGDIPVPPERVAVTLFWKPFLARPATTLHDTIRFRSIRICRLHQMGTCRLGRDCKNLHVCREFWTTAGLATPAEGLPVVPVLPQPLPPPAPSLPMAHPAPVSANPLSASVPGSPPPDSAVLWATAPFPAAPLPDVASSSSHVPPGPHYRPAAAPRPGPGRPAAPTASAAAPAPWLAPPLESLLYSGGGPSLVPLPGLPGSAPLLPPGTAGGRCLALLGWGLPIAGPLMPTDQPPDA